MTNVQFVATWLLIATMVMSMGGMLGIGYPAVGLLLWMFLFRFGGRT